MQKDLKPLKEIKDKYDEDMFEVLVSEMLNMPEIKHTKEIQRCFQRMAHEYAETTYPKRLRKSTKCRSNSLQNYGNGSSVCILKLPIIFVVSNIKCRGLWRSKRKIYINT